MIIGDEVFFFFTDYGTHVWGDGQTIIYPKHVDLVKGKIIAMNEAKDYVHVYVEGITSLLCFGYCFHEDYFFESIEEAIAEMTQKLMNL